jgi:hypothetical protein
MSQFGVRSDELPNPLFNTDARKSGTRWLTQR